MPDMRRGAGVLFYDRQQPRVLLYRRDNKPSLPFPDHLDILGGHTEPGESPEQTAVREIAEELDDLRTGRPFVLLGHKLFATYADAQGITHAIYGAEADFDLSELRLKEGQALVWVTEEEVRRTPLAFGFNAVVAAFFHALRVGAI